MDPLAGLFPQCTAALPKRKREVDHKVGFLEIESHRSRLVLNKCDRIILGLVSFKIMSLSVHDAVRSAIVDRHPLKDLKLSIEVIKYDDPLLSALDDVFHSTDLLFRIMTTELSRIEEL